MIYYIYDEKNDAIIYELNLRGNNGRFEQVERV